MSMKRIAILCTALGALLGGTTFYLTRPSKQGERTPATTASQTVPNKTAPPVVPPPVAPPVRPPVQVDRPNGNQPAVEIADPEPEVKLKPRPRPQRTGTLSVNVSERFANVYVDGDLKGQTPIEIPLSVGKHEVVIEDPLDPKERFLSTVEIKADETTKLKESLSPPGTAGIDGRLMNERGMKG